MLDIEWPKHFANDKDFIEFVERKTVEIYGLYLEKEEEAKITSLGSQKCINRVFDLMGVEYDDRPILAEEKDEAAERAKGKKPALTKDKKVAKAKGPRTVARKRKASEPGDVRLGRELVRPSKKSLKFTLGGSGCGSGAADEERVRRDFDVPSFCVVDSFHCLLI